MEEEHDRPKRKRNSRKKISRSHYLGYARDEESIEDIMKKFDALEQYQNEQSNSMDGSSNVEEKPEGDLLSEEQLEELYSRMHPNRKFAPFYADEMESYADLYFDEWYSDGDDDDGEDWFDNERRVFKRSKRGGIPSSSRKEKYILVTMQDESGDVYTIKRRVRVVHPTDTLFTRIPREVPETWAIRVTPYEEPAKKDQIKSIPGCFVHDLGILQSDLNRMPEMRDERFSAALLDPPWEYGFEPGHLRSKLRFDFGKFISNGLVFIWAPKNLTHKVLEVFETWGFIYVENLVWVKLNINCKFNTEMGKYFTKSKETLLILRKVSKTPIELRHQRSPDVIFDFERHYEQNGRILTEKPTVVYETIETLLPEANFKESTGRGEFIEFWAKAGVQRKGWTHIVDKSE